MRASAFTCTTPGCSRKARFNSGRCAKHQAEVVLARQQSEPQRPLCRYSEITGEYPACTRKAAIHGLCRGHYISVRYSPEWEINLPEQSRAERCLMPECDLPQMWGGLCRGHNQKVRVTNKGDLDKLLRREVEITPLTTAAHEQFRLWRTLRGQTMEELAKKIGVSRERVRQIEIKLYARLKNSVSQSRQQGRLTASELSYLQSTEFPVEHLVFGSEEYV